jgi:hypothetical protein
VWEGRSRKAPPYPDLWHFSDLAIASRDVRSSVQSRPRRIHDWRGMDGTACSRNERLWNARFEGPARSCKLDVAATVGLSVDQSIKSCVSEEQKARTQLRSRWSKFLAPSKQRALGRRALAALPAMSACRHASSSICGPDSRPESGSFSPLELGDVASVNRSDRTRSMQFVPPGQNQQAIRRRL